MPRHKTIKKIDDSTFISKAVKLRDKSVKKTKGTLFYIQTQDIY